MKRHLLLLAILALIGALAIPATCAVAASRPGSTSSLSPLDGEEEDEEGGFLLDEELESGECPAEEIDWEEEELDEAEEEVEEDCAEAEAGKGEKDPPFVTAPAACRVSQAESTIAMLPAGDEVRLTVHYRTWDPTAVTVGLKLRDGKGAIGIEHTVRRLGDHGVLRITTKLGDGVMDRAMNAGEFDVSLTAPGTPGFCAGALEQRLRSVEHASASARRLYSS